MVILDIMAAQQGELYHFFLFKGTSSFPQKLQVLHFKLQVFLQKQQMSIDTLYRILQNKRQVTFLLSQIQTEQMKYESMIKIGITQFHVLNDNSEQPYSLKLTTL